MSLQRLWKALVWLSYEPSCLTPAPDPLAPKFPVQPGRAGAYSCPCVLRYPRIERMLLSVLVPYKAWAKSR